MALFQLLYFIQHLLSSGATRFLSAPLRIILNAWMIVVDKNKFFATKIDGENTVSKIILLRWLECAQVKLLNHLHLAIFLVLQVARTVHLLEHLSHLLVHLVQVILKCYFLPLLVHVFLVLPVRRVSVRR